MRANKLPIADSPEPLTREQWLTRATIELNQRLFEPHKATIPPVRVSVGFPGGGSRRTTIGEYWHAQAIADKIPQIFISPTLDNPISCLEVLVHELVHACTPGAGHSGAFKRLAKDVGLQGRAKATHAGPSLKVFLDSLAYQLGPYPHSKINLADRKKQSTRLIKVSCPIDGYVARVTRTWLNEMGTPTCPCGEVMGRDDE